MSLTVTGQKRGTAAQLVDVTCTFGRHDRPFPERHASGAWAVAIVRRGTFVYRNDASTRRHALREGWLLVGRPEVEYECSHDHDGGDMCTSLTLDERLVDDAAAAAHIAWSRVLASAPVLAPDARIAALLEHARIHDGPIDEVACLVAERFVAHASHAPTASDLPTPAHVACAHAAAAQLEARCTEPISLAVLAASVGLSQFHFLRVFRRVTGTTPHQYLVGARLRLAAKLLLDTKKAVTEVAYDSGFSDLSNFVRTFHRVVGASPRKYRKWHEQDLPSPAARPSS